MNILYHVHRFPLPSFILNEIYELEKQGHSVAVFVLNKGAGYVEHEETDRVDAPFYFADFTTPRSLPELLSPTLARLNILKEAAFSAHPKYHIRMLHQTKQCIEFVESLDMEIDVIHGHFPTRAKLSAIATAEYLGIPCTVAAHDLSDYYTGEARWIHRVFNRVDRITAISEHSQSKIQDIGIQPPVDIVHMGIRPEKYEPTETHSDHRLLTIARLEEKKGIEYAIEAVSQLVVEFPELQYHIIGSGSKEDELEQQVQQNGLNEQVRLLGFVSDDRLIKELDEATGFVLPSIITEDGKRDGIPVALMESMAMKTPPVTTTVAGIPELVDHETNGLLVEPRDSEGLVEAIGLLLRNPEIQIQYGDAAREKVLAKFNSRIESRKLVETFYEAGVQ